MLKAVAAVIGGLAAGFVIASLWSSDSADTPLSTSAPQDWSGRIAELEMEFREERELRAALERRVEELDAEIQTLRETEAIVVGAARDERREEVANAPAEAVPEALARRFGARFGDGERTEREIAALVAGGFAPTRAEWLARRAGELQMQALQNVYEARREGKPLDPTIADDRSLLRSEIGDAEYEQYLTALGRPTTVDVGNVLASSPAEAAGLRAGDEIVRYAGTRVYDVRDLNRLTFEGQAGESVIVDVVRDGREMQLVLPRGPLGIQGGGRFRGRP